MPESRESSLMKRIRLSYHSTFPATPISGWCGQQFSGWVCQRSRFGQIMNPKYHSTPFKTQRRLWCLMEVDFRKTMLYFATPIELDSFLDVMSRNPLPSGGSLVRGQRFGRPNNHWLSRLPRHTKSWKFRQAICKFLETAKDVEDFRNFYSLQPVKTRFEGFFRTPWEARAHAEQ